jgi:hypothetical protein
MRITTSEGRLGRLTTLAQRVGITLILLAFLALGAYYTFTTPLFETPDEPFHYRYIQWLVNERRLPPLVVSDEEWEQGELHQPPLYYAVAATLTGWIETPPVDDLYPRNPYANLGFPHTFGNKNAVLHLYPERASANGIPLAVHLLRLFNVLLGAATVWVVYLTAQEAVPGRALVHLGAAALTALNPQFIFASAGVNNDALVSLLTVATVYLAGRLAHDTRVNWRLVAALGLLIGLAGLTKLSGLAVAVVVPVACWLRSPRRGLRALGQQVALPSLVVAAIALGVCGWWYLRNAQLYGDLLGMRSYQAIYSVYPEPLPFTMALTFLAESLTSYWGVFGWMNIVADELFYTLVRVITVVGTAGALLLALRLVFQREGAEGRRRILALLALWAVVMAGLLFRWTQTITRTQGRLMFPAVSAVSTLLAVGLVQWAPRRYAPWLLGAPAALLLSVALVTPYLYILPAYEPPPRFAFEAAPSPPHGLDVSFGDAIFLLGYDLPEPSVPLGKQARVRLYWLARRKMDTDYTFYVHLFGREGARIGALDTYPGAGNYPTSRWIPGEVVVDEYVLDLDPTAVVPVAASVRVGIYQGAEMEPLEAADLYGQPLGPAPEIARLRVASPFIHLYRPARTTTANFDDKIALIGYSLDNHAPSPGDTVRVTLYWQGLAPMPADYTVFVHLLDRLDNMVAQVDAQPLDGAYPTSFWAAHEQVKDTHYLSLPGDLALGEYQLRVGLYQLATGERLPLAGVEPLADSLTLETLTLARVGGP